MGSWSTHSSSSFFSKRAGSVGGARGWSSGHACQRSAVFVLDLNDRLARHALANVVCGALAFQDHNVQLRRRRSRLGLLRQSWNLQPKQYNKRRG